MIVVEGPDNSGKTTMIGKLAKAFNLEVRQSCGPNADQHEWVRQQLDDPTLKVIYDRFSLISESIYGPVIRGSDRFNNPEGSELFIQFFRKRPLILDFSHSVMPLDDRPQMGGVRENQERLVTAYQDFFARIHNHYHLSVQCKCTEELHVFRYVKIYLATKGLF